jgi:hypothetical protein
MVLGHTFAVAAPRGYNGALKRRRAGSRPLDPVLQHGGEELGGEPSVSRLGARGELGRKPKEQRRPSYRLGLAGGAVSFLAADCCSWRRITECAYISCTCLILGAAIRCCSGVSKT